MVYVQDSSIFGQKRSPVQSPLAGPSARRLPHGTWVLLSRLLQFVTDQIRAVDFERRFSLAHHMKVVSASLDNGMLSVDVVHEVPEAAKPRTIKIGTTVNTVQPQVMEQKAA